MSRLVSISDITVPTPRYNNYRLANIGDNGIATPTENYSLDNLSLNCGEELTEQDWDTVTKYRWVKPTSVCY